MRTILIAVLIWASFSVLAQNNIKGTIVGLAGKKIAIQSIFGERTKTIDSTLTDSTGQFQLTMKGRLPGMYRLYWAKEGMVDVIWNREDIHFKTNESNPEDSLKFIGSIENQLYQSFIRMDRINQSKLQVLVPVIDFYPSHDAFYQTAINEFENIQRLQQRFLDSAANLYPNSYAVRLAKVYSSPFIPAAMNKDDRMTYLKQRYFDKVNFSDTSLLRSMVFPNKAISYMSLYSNNRLPQKQLEAEFIKAVNVILGAASVNPDVYRFLLDYLVSGFDKFHFDEVITYIADNFKDPSSCEDQTRKSALQKKLETFQKLAVGKTAPELEVPDVKGKPVKLADIGSEYTLLVFWSTTCPHCVAMMPRLKEFYAGQQPKRFEVMSVSIDTSRAEWTTFLKEEKLNWINVSDLKGFAGKSADDYNIYATPTIFLLDREKKILAKPITLMELEQALRDHQLIR
ncbi:MAG: redoxin domain-containing protein [Bacteroidota bacterium]